MAWFTRRLVFLFLGILVSRWGWEMCEGSATFGLDIHHRFSDQVKEILGSDGLPDMGTFEYYKAMVSRDRLIRGRLLASKDNRTTVTFSLGNRTHNLDLLHYANVTVGTPAKWFLVGLDTGSDLFWLPCDCTKTCVRSMETDKGRITGLNIYSPNASSSSSKILCNSTTCRQANRCSSALSDCPYQVRYLSNGTSITGILVEDLLHLTTEDRESKAIDARITLGCGQFQTGIFQDSAVNGLFGLGLEDISVPSILAKAGIASDSFSMCFGFDRKGRISFGDKGSSDQLETPLNPMLFNPHYNVTVSQISIRGAASDEEFTAIFDSGTAVTWLLDPHYSFLTRNFHSLIQDRRIPQDPDNPFEFCYELTPFTNESEIPAVDFIMKGGALYRVYSPVLAFTFKGGDVYCLAVLKVDEFEFNIIGQNFMAGYRIVHDREKMVLGWKESECYDDSASSSPGGAPLPPNGQAGTRFPYSPPIRPFFPNPDAVPFPSSSHRLNPFPCTLGVILLLLSWIL